MRKAGNSKGVDLTSRLQIYSNCACVCVCSMIYVFPSHINITSGFIIPPSNSNPLEAWLYSRPVLHLYPSAFQWMDPSIHSLREHGDFKLSPTLPYRRWRLSSPKECLSSGHGWRVNRRQIKSSAFQYPPFCPPQKTSQLLTAAVNPNVRPNHIHQVCCV